MGIQPYLTHKSAESGGAASESMTEAFLPLRPTLTQFFGCVILSDGVCKSTNYLAIDETLSAI